jgi:hypothetical protein
MLKSQRYLEHFHVAKEGSPDSDSHHFNAMSLPDLIQVGGVILGILSGFVFANTARARLATILITCAASLLCGTLYFLAVRRARWRSPRILLQVALSLTMIAVAAIYANPPAQATGNADSPGDGTVAGNVPSVAGPPAPAIEKAGYVLRPSFEPLTNDQDKVDLDTGCPGWGDMHPHIGPSRCGDLADLVLDPDSLHTANGRPNIMSIPPGASGAYSSCRALLGAAPTNSVNSIQASSLQNGETLCVRTDIGNIAAVRLVKVVTDSMGQLASVTLDFQVWTA